MQAIKVVVQFENPTLIKSQTLPDSIPTLHGRIEWTDPSLVAMNELAVDVNDQIAVSFVESLEHYWSEDYAAAFAALRLAKDFRRFPKQEFIICVNLRMTSLTADHDQAAHYPAILTAQS